MLEWNETDFYLKNLRRRALIRQNILGVQTKRTLSGIFNRILSERNLMELNKDKIEQVRSEVELVARLVVDSPNSLFVTAETGEQTVHMKLSCARDDLGKVIGKKGRMAESIRTILYSISTKHGFRSVLSIEE